MRKVSALPLLALLLAGPRLAAQTASIPKIWSGEIVEADQGLVTFYGTVIDASVKPRDNTFAFILQGRKYHYRYNFHAKTSDPRLPPQTYWKIHEDVYDLVEASLVDERGRRRVFKGPYAKPLLVKPQSLSSMGRWYLIYGKTEGTLSMLLKPWHMNVSLAGWKGSVQTLIDAFTGTLYQTYRGPSAQDPSALRKVIRVSRGISMLYKIDLYRQNAYAPDLARVLEANDADIRSCYTDLLEKQGDVKGKLAYSFVYSGNNQGIKSLKLREATITDPGFQECMDLKLRGLTFPLRQSVAGDLLFQFTIVE